MEFSFILLGNDEFRITKSERSPKLEIRTKRLSLVTFGRPISDLGFHSLFGIRISDLIRHSEFVIRHSSFTPERCHRIDLRRTPCREPAGKQGYGRKQQSDRNEGHWIGAADAEEVGA